MMGALQIFPFFKPVSGVHIRHCQFEKGSLKDERQSNKISTGLSALLSKVYQTSATKYEPFLPSLGCLDHRPYCF